MHIVVVGGGVGGLGTALACARDGHQVTVLERDDTPMPETPDAAFGWVRRGAPQVRHSHAFLARMRMLLLDRAPDVLDALFAAGATELSFTANLPESLTDQTQWPGDDELVAIACRRTTFEWVLRRHVLAQPGVALRHGAAAEGLLASAGSGPVPLVTGVVVRDAAGGVREVAADLVVDARGPRSSSDDWLAAIGARPVPEVLHESGIVYFSRFYRLVDGVEPPPTIGPAAADLGYLKYAVFIGDNRTFSITYAVDAHDEQLRKGLTAPDMFEAAARMLVATAPWRADGLAEPITDVHVMAGLRNRHRPFVVNGAPIVSGFLPVGDAALCTNPLYGRGCSLALVHAFGLADALREHPEDLDAVAHALHELTNRELVPWFRSAVLQDEQARAVQQEVSPEDPRAFMRAVLREGLLPALRSSALVYRAFLRWFNLLATADALMNDPEIVAEVLAAYNDRENRPAPQPFGPETRTDFLAQLPMRR